MQEILSNKGFWIDALLKEIQYLNNLAFLSKFWENLERSIENFFSPDLYLLIEKEKKKDSYIHQKIISKYKLTENANVTINKVSSEVFESGFIASETINKPDPYNLVFLPISVERKNIGIIVIGYNTNKKLTKNILHTYLTLSNVISSTLERLKTLDELKIHRNELQKIVKERTNDLKSINIKLMREIQIRKKAETEIKEAEQKLLEFNKELENKVQERTMELKKSEQELKESEAKFRTFAEQTIMGIYIIQDNKIKYANQAMSDINGYFVDEMKGWGSEGFINVVHPDYREFVREQAKKKQQGLKDVVNNYTVKIIKKTGEHRWIETFTKTIMYKGRLADFITVVDVTEKKEAEKLIIKENVKLMELSQMRQDLITRISHELKTPLTSIYGVSQAFLEIPREELNEEILEYIDISHRGCLRLKELIDNLIDASRLDSKKLELKIQRENLANLIKECINDMMFLIKARNHSIKIDLPKEIFLEIDKLRLSQAITNLISNAIKNTSVGGKIFLGIKETLKFIDIQVKDTGVGLTGKEKNKLFTKFGKIERHGMNLEVDIEGVGLGLYISKEIVELHGGQILVESGGRNEGAAFTIRLFKKLSVKIF